MTPFSRSSSLLHPAFCLSSIIAAVWPCVSGYSYVRGTSSVPASCPGFYCGRINMTDGNWSACGACPRGFRAQGISKCVQCQSEPSFYDAMYLMFMALVSLTLHWRSISAHSRKHRATSLSSSSGSADNADGWSLTMGVARQYLSALVEAVLSAVITLLLFDPVGTFRVRSCPAHSLADWYTLLYNPSPNYDHTLSCTQEAVYPLYSGVLLYYAISLVMLLVVRPWLGGNLGGCLACCCQFGCRTNSGKVSRCRPKTTTRSTAIHYSSGPIYSALLFTPALMAVHAVLAGMIHATFAYLTLVVSVASVALLLARQPDQQPLSLLQMGRVRPCHGLALSAHWFAHAFGVLALDEASTSWQLVAQLMVAMLAPTLFYVMTVRFTAPGLLGAPMQPAVSQQQQQQQQGSSSQPRVRDRVGYLVESS